MIEEILAWVSNLVLTAISMGGYWGILWLMLVESANIPIPSEVIMPFAGFLAATGRFNLWMVIFVGAVGNLLGSWLSYGVAFWLGVSINRFFKRIKFFKNDYEKAEKFFCQHGLSSVFWGRLLPVVRGFISLPAGIFRLSFWKFSFLTFIGSFIWSGFLTWIGFVLGENWKLIERYFRRFDYLLVVILLILVIGYFWQKMKSKKSKED